MIEDTSMVVFPEPGPAADSPPAKGKRPKLWIAVAVCLLALLPVVESRYFTCAACGKRRTEHQLLGQPVVATEAETRCSRWYASRFGFDEPHRWVAGSWTEIRALCGLRYFGTHQYDRTGGPVAEFTPQMQLLIYECFPDPVETKSMFLSLAQWELEGTPERQRQEEMASRLRIWGSGSTRARSADAD